MIQFTAFALQDTLLSLLLLQSLIRNPKFLVQLNSIHLVA